MAWAIESRRVTAEYPPPSRGRVAVKAREKGNLAAYGREKLLNSRNVGIGGLEPGAHGIHRQMRRSESTPVLSLLRPGIRRAIGYANAPFDADAGWITSSRPRVATHALKRGPPLVVRRKLREPTIGQTSNAFDHRFDTRSPATKPQGNGTLDRQRVEASVANMVPAPMEIDHVLRPQRPHHGNLFLRALTTIVEILTQSLIFRLDPANPNSQAHAPTAQYIDFRRLFRYQRRLPLAQNDDRGYQLDALRHRRQIPIEHKGLMKQIVLRIRPLPPLVMRGVYSQDM